MTDEAECGEECGRGCSEREMRGRVLDAYPADYERRCGRLPEGLVAEARQLFDQVFAEHRLQGEGEGEGVAR
ncbi:hypothetical protein ACFWG7_01940 [Streptomyces koyangensis]|uniref:hypothetical protein n=1 Tax=Streptomyces koyangensis TaxID=188770 RepID=UPI003649CC3D